MEDDNCDIVIDIKDVNKNNINRENAFIELNKR